MLVIKEKGITMISRFFGLVLDGELVQGLIWEEE